MKTGFCIICREYGKDLTDEHVIPDAIGGVYHIYNVCKDCNSKLGDTIDNNLINHWLTQGFRHIYKIGGKRKMIPNPLIGQGELDSGQHVRTVEDATGKIKPILIPSSPEVTKGEDGKLYLNFGFHTTRMYDDSKTTLPVMRQAFDSLGHTVSLNYDTISGRVPAGASFAISSDGGETFTKSHILSHFCENPSIYAAPKDNTLRMLANYGARGTWRSDSLSGGWTCINADFPPGGDCTFPFIVGDYDYIVGGFRGMWGKPGNADIAAFEDFVAQGKDCYDGLSVPAVTRLPDGRTMMAGWVKMQPWGGALVVHEIVPNGKDGAIGSKWVDEMIPQLPRVTLDKTLTATGLPSSFICDFTLSPKKMNQGKISVCLSGDTFWTLDLNDDRIWFASTEAERSNTLGEGGDVAAAHDYAIPARLKGMKSIPVRILVKSEPKYCGCLIDIEIARCRTMLSYRPDTNINSIAISTDGMTVK